MSNLKPTLPKKLDKNGYGDSIFNTKQGTCYMCNCMGDTVRHETERGANRKMAKAYGMWINLCPSCHTLSPYAVHNNYTALKQLQEQGKRLFIERYSEEEYRRIFK